MSKIFFQRDRILLQNSAALDNPLLFSVIKGGKKSNHDYALRRIYPNVTSFRYNILLSQY